MDLENELSRMTLEDIKELMSNKYKLERFVSQLSNEDTLLLGDGFHLRRLLSNLSNQEIDELFERIAEQYGRAAAKQQAKKIDTIEDASAQVNPALLLAG